MLDAIAKALCDLDIEYFSLHCYVPDASAGVSEVVVEVEEDDIVNVILTRTVDNGSVSTT